MLVVGEYGELRIEERNLISSERKLPNGSSRVISFFGNSQCGKSFLMSHLISDKENPNHCMLSIFLLQFFLLIF